MQGPARPRRGLTKGSAARECTVQGIYREYTGNIKGVYREYTGDIQGVTIQASAAREAATNFSAIFHTYCLLPRPAGQHWWSIQFICVQLFIGQIVKIFIFQH